MKQTLSKRQLAALEVMSKPKTPAEIGKQVGLKNCYNISSILQGLVYLNLMYCLNPKAKVGKLYGLTSKGRKLIRSIFTVRGLSFNYVEPKLNWNLYGWIVSGRQKRAILKAMKTPMPMKYIKERAQTYNPRISRMNANDILQLFVKKGIAYKTWEGNRVFFSLTKTGEALRDQLLEP